MACTGPIINNNPPTDNLYLYNTQEIYYINPGSPGVLCRIGFYLKVTGVVAGTVECRMVDPVGKADLGAFGIPIDMATIGGSYTRYDFIGTMPFLPGATAIGIRGIYTIGGGDPSNAVSAAVITGGGYDAEVVSYMFPPYPPGLPGGDFPGVGLNSAKWFDVINTSSFSYSQTDTVLGGGSKITMTDVAALDDGTGQTPITIRPFTHVITSITEGAPATVTNQSGSTNTIVIAPSSDASGSIFKILSFGA